jgi:hypothetical protein
MSFRLSAVAVAGLEEGPWGYLLDIASCRSELPCKYRSGTWMLLDATLRERLYLVLPGT